MADAHLNDLYAGDRYVSGVIIPSCGLISSMHSWGLYNGRYGLLKLVLLDKIASRGSAAGGQDAQ